MKIYNPNITRFLTQSKLDALSKPEPQNEKNMQAQKLKKACRDFEAIFISYMLKSMNKTTENSDLFGSGLGGDIYKEIFNEKLAEHLSNSGGFKIGDMIFENYSRMLNLSNDNKSLDYTVPPRIKVRSNNDDLTELFTVMPEPDRTKVEITPGPSQKEITVEKTKSSKPDMFLAQFDDAINKAAKEYKIKPSLIKAVIRQESAGNPQAVSSKGAKGLMQLIDSTAEMLGVKDPFNPIQNIMGGAKYLSMLIKRFGGDLSKALASYNAGPAAVEKYNGIPPFPETRKYVSRIMASLSSE